MLGAAGLPAPRGGADLSFEPCTWPRSRPGTDEDEGGASCGTSGRDEVLLGRAEDTCVADASPSVVKVPEPEPLSPRDCNEAGIPYCASMDGWNPSWEEAWW